MNQNPGGSPAQNAAITALVPIVFLVSSAALYFFYGWLTDLQFVWLLRRFQPVLLAILAAGIGFLAFVIFFVFGPKGSFILARTDGKPSRFAAARALVSGVIGAMIPGGLFIYLAMNASLPTRAALMTVLTVFCASQPFILWLLVSLANQRLNPQHAVRQPAVGGPENVGIDDAAGNQDDATGKGE